MKFSSASSLTVIESLPQSFLWKDTTIYTAIRSPLSAVFAAKASLCLSTRGNIRTLILNKNRSFVDLKAVLKASDREESCLFTDEAIRALKRRIIGMQTAFQLKAKDSYRLDPPLKRKMDLRMKVSKDQRNWSRIKVRRKVIWRKLL